MRGGAAPGVKALSLLKGGRLEAERGGIEAKKQATINPKGAWLRPRSTILSGGDGGDDDGAAADGSGGSGRRRRRRARESGSQRQGALFGGQPEAGRGRGTGAGTTTMTTTTLTALTGVTSRSCRRRQPRRSGRQRGWDQHRHAPVPPSSHPPVHPIWAGVRAILLH